MGQKVYYVKCYYCNGSGIVTNYVTKYANGKPYQAPIMTTCAKCRGKGKLEVRG